MQCFLSCLIELIDVTCTLLLLNPDFATAWNVRLVLHLRLAPFPLLSYAIWVHLLNLYWFTIHGTLITQYKYCIHVSLFIRQNLGTHVITDYSLTGCWQIILWDTQHIFLFLSQTFLYIRSYPNSYSGIYLLAVFLAKVVDLSGFILACVFLIPNLSIVILEKCSCSIPEKLILV